MVKADKDTMKNYNRQIVINSFFRKEVVSKGEIIANTGLSAASVNNIMQQLVVEGILEETEFGFSKGGRRPMLYRLNTTLFNILNCKITHKGIIAALCDINGKIIVSKTLIIDIVNPEGLITAFENVLTEIRKTNQALLDSIKAVGITIPGIINYSQRVVTLSTPLHLENFSLQSMVDSYFQKEMELQLFKDADALLYGEYYFGQDPSANMAYLLNEDGVGFSIIIKDQLFFADNCGMELGHTIVNLNGKFCRCGSRGCIGTLLGEKSAVEKYINLSTNLDSVNLKYSDLIKLAQDGDEIAKTVMEEQYEILSIAAINVINLFNPSCLILGGPLASYQEVAEYVQNVVTTRALKPFASKVKIRNSQLNTNSCLSAMALRISLDKFFMTNK